MADPVTFLEILTQQYAPLGKANATNFMEVLQGMNQTFRIA
jgi:hypothetical protein